MADVSTRAVLELDAVDKTAAALTAVNARLDMMAKKARIAAMNNAETGKKLEDIWHRPMQMFTGMVFLRWGQKAVDGVVNLMSQGAIRAMDNMKATMNAGFAGFSETVSRRATEMAERSRRELEDLYGEQARLDRLNDRRASARNAWEMVGVSAEQEDLVKLTQKHRNELEQVNKEYAARAEKIKQLNALQSERKSELDLYGENSKEFKDAEADYYEAKAEFERQMDAKGWTDRLINNVLESASQLDKQIFESLQEPVKDAAAKMEVLRNRAKDLRLEFDREGNTIKNLTRDQANYKKELMAIQGLMNAEITTYWDEKYNDMLKTRSDLLEKIEDQVRSAAQTSNAFFGGSYEFMRYMRGGAGPAVTGAQGSPMSKPEYRSNQQSQGSRADTIMDEIRGILDARLPKYEGVI